MLKVNTIVPYLPEINNMIGKPWTFRAILEFRRVRKRRYGELLESLDGISTSTLSIILKNLQKDGIIEKKSYGERPPFRVEYNLTDKGLDFLIACYPLLQWSVKNKLLV